MGIQLDYKGLDSRQQKVLFAIIAQYVEFGSPVSSKTISLLPELELSPASIRRIMNDLTAMGLLVQPHTSAGRIPTDHGFRLFVNALREERVGFDVKAQEALTSRLKGQDTLETSMWLRTVKLLSELSKQAAMIITPAISDAVLRRLSLIEIGDGQLLAVVVTREGLVQNSFLGLDSILQPGELEKINNYLTGILSGRSLNDIRAILRSELEDARKQQDAIREKAATLGVQALKESDHSSSQLLVEGRSMLVEQPELEGKLHSLMETLEHKSRILELLDQAARSDSGPLVIIGEEGGKGFEGCALISAPFGAEGSRGQIGVVGSTRMNFQNMMPLVSLSAQLLSDDGKKPK